MHARIDVAGIGTDQQPPAPRPHLRLSPRTGWLQLDLPEIWRSRDLLLMLAGRDLKLRYKQTALGVAWVVLQPLLAAAVFAFVFGLVARLDAPGQVPYFLFAFAGLLAWQFFATIVQRATASAVADAQLLSKVYFPRLVLPIAASLSAFVDFLIGMALLAVMVPVFWRVPGVELLLVVPLILLLFVLGFAIGTFAASLAVEYRDVNHAMPVAIQMMMYASPVAYSIALVPEKYRALYLLNPLASVLEAFRFSVLGTGAVNWGGLAYSAMLALGLLVAALVLFKRMERGFADVV